MSLRTRLGVVIVAASFIGISGTLTARQAPPERQRQARPDFDIREHRAPSPASARARAELQRSSSRLHRGSRLDPHTGALRVLDAPGWTAARTALPLSLRNQLVSAVDRLGLDDDDLDGLTVVRDYTSRSNGVRHVTFAQAFDGIPVFGGEITVHIAANGEIVTCELERRTRGRAPSGTIGDGGSGRRLGVGRHRSGRGVHALAGRKWRAAGIIAVRTRPVSA